MINTKTNRICFSLRSIKASIAKSHKSIRQAKTQLSIKYANSRRSIGLAQTHIIIRHAKNHLGSDSYVTAWWVRDDQVRHIQTSSESRVSGGICKLEYQTKVCLGKLTTVKGLKCLDALFLQRQQGSQEGPGKCHMSNSE